MIKASTIQLLRFHFSFFLLPVYLFAMGQVPEPDTTRSILIFIILHVLIYPSSNGYNSYMDRDEESVGGIEKPMQPTVQLFYASVLLDIAGVALSFMVSLYFAIGIIIYILASRAYSYRGIRLKQYPFLGYLVVIACQGALVFFITWHGASGSLTTEVPLTPVIASSLLIGGFYPLTQIYQHKADIRDGVRTISYVLGYRGTFVFTAIIYVGAMSLLAQYFYFTAQENKLLTLATLMLPILVYFFRWAAAIWKDTDAANFSNTMRMNLIASVCTNLAFFTLLIWKFLE
ncbi:MAG: prenyltransferase [Chitinophagaceae bacterium]|nr:MAG: prenyltransferase [Chitinophagaceae bacterium]